MPSIIRMRNLAVLLAVGIGIGGPALAQEARPTDEEEIVVVGIRDGDRVVEVDFDKVWRNCAECKRALAKLDRLAAAYRDEVEVAAHLSSGGGTAHCSRGTPNSVSTFQRSSAEPTDMRRRTPQSIADGLCAARLADTSRRTHAAISEKYVAPERAKLLGHMRAFLDQLTPHVVTATEQERVARGARASLVGKLNAKISARKLVRINVTDAVIKRLDAKDFTIVLPEPVNRSGARK